MKKSVIVILFFAAVAFVTWNVHAASDAFSKADRDRNGVITTDEFESAVRSKFKEYDRNNDGRIDVDEFSAKGHPEAVKEFKFMDRNSDGFVNADEFYRAAIQRRDQLDFNRDSKISKEEYNSNKALPFLKFYF
jgi:Ca2+-binding EF-hand superfamily protein